MASNSKNDSLDEDFRGKVRKLLDEAEQEIFIITGEGGSYQYQDLRWALERAQERGVSVKIYCVHPPQTYVNKNLQLGSDVYIGNEDLENHYLVVDGKHTIVSKIRAGEEVGKRKGELKRNEEEFAREKIDLFHKLASQAEKINEPKIDEDPLQQLIQNPLNFGYDTHSEKFEEEL